MDTFRGEGDIVQYTNAGAAITSGTPVVLVTGNNGALGIAVTDIAATTGTGSVKVTGVHELTCVTTDTGAIGVKVYWDAGNSRLTTTASTHTYAGRLAKVKANGETTAYVRLNGLAFA